MDTEAATRQATQAGESTSPRTLREQHVRVKHGQFRLWRRGEGAPILFLHGAGGPEMWFEFLERWRGPHEVLLAEHPGFGKAGLPGWLETVDDLAYAYLDLFEALGLSGVHLVGHSLGGWAAMEIVVRHPAALRSLTLISATGLRAEGVRVADNFLWTPEDAARNLFADPEIVARQLEHVPDADERLLRLQRMKTVAKLVWNPRWHNPHLGKWLHRIACPTLIVWGRQDRFVPPPYATALAAAIPGAAVEWINACGHVPQLDRSAELERRLADFIARVAT